MEFIIDNWYMFVIAVCVIAGIILAVMKFCKQSNKEKYDQIRGWLLQAVILAEQEYGSGTGQMKLSVVYDAFCTALPWIAKVITFEQFSKYVDEALEDARNILEGNNSMAALAETMVHKDESGCVTVNSEEIIIESCDEGFYVRDSE